MQPPSFSGKNGAIGEVLGALHPRRRLAVFESTLHACLGTVASTKQQIVCKARTLGNHFDVRANSLWCGALCLRQSSLRPVRWFLYRCFVAYSVASWIFSVLCDIVAQGMGYYLNTCIYQSIDSMTLAQLSTRTRQVLWHLGDEVSQTHSRCQGQDCWYFFETM